MVWKRIDDNQPTTALPVKLVGEPPDTYWVDQDGAPVKTNNPADYPTGITESSPFPPGNVPAGEATIQKIYDLLKAVANKIL